MTKIPRYPRYSWVTLAATAALRRKGIDSFPVDVKAAIKSFGIKLKKYSTLSKQTGATIEDIGKAYKTNLGYIYRNEKGNYFIAYNDSLDPGLIRFTLAHELAHFFLNHLEDYEQTELKYNSLVPYSNEHLVLEREANCFARNFLSPILIAKLIGDQVQSIQHFFGLTYSASRVRIESLNIDEESTKKIALSKVAQNELFHLEKVKFKYANYYHCDICSGEFFCTSPCCCVFCGEKLFWKIEPASFSILRDFGGDKMEYSRIETDPEGHPKQCPQCNAENIRQEHTFCPFCSSILHNSCLGGRDNRFIELDAFGGHEEKSLIDQIQGGCSGYLDGGYRYCPECGGETSYYRQGLLKDWKEDSYQNNKKFESENYTQLPF